MTTNSRHAPVLVREVLSHLAEHTKTFLDGTVGDGGHVEKVAEKFPKLSHIYALDRDEKAIARAQAHLQSLAIPITYFVSSYEFARHQLSQIGVEEVDAILLDLGFSTPQIASSRGFSFLEPGFLDMRYDQSQELTAAKIINKWNKGDIEKILREYGDEPNARGLADAIVDARKRAEIETTEDLVDIILGWYRKKLHSKKEIPWIGGIHPATRTFQALRIEVNDELGTLTRALPELVKLLKKNGRLAIITFHSGEDKIVKQFFKHESRTCICPPEYPQCVCHHAPSLAIITKKPITASEEELKSNTKSRSAKLRVAEKI